MSIQNLYCSLMGAEACRKVDTDNDNYQLQNRARFNNPIMLCCVGPDRKEEYNDQPLKPIEFSELGDKTPTQSAHIETEGNLKGNKNMETPQKAHLQIEDGSTSDNLNHKRVEQNEEIVESPKKSSTLVVINSQNIMNDASSYQRISVPFSVVRLCIKPQIIKHLKKIYKTDFDEKHGKMTAQTYRTWKLHQKGCYINQISDGTTIVITDDEYFQGYTLPQSFIPDGDGILMKQNFSFKGSFKNGKANGRGLYSQFKNLKKFDGAWRNGFFQSGSIETEDYKYEGKFKNNKPHGQGELQLVKKKVEYKGLFVEGMFEDSEGIYICEKYKYQGGFKKGKKDGKGTLIKKKTYLQSEKISVIFENDKLVFYEKLLK